jgi:hypothetical protein
MNIDPAAIFIHTTGRNTPRRNPRIIYLYRIEVYSATRTRWLAGRQPIFSSIYFGTGQAVVLVNRAHKCR